MTPSTLTPNPSPEGRDTRRARVGLSSAPEPSAGTRLRTMARLLRGLPRDGTHAQRLERFYAPQAEGYDAFREGLLHGRPRLVAALRLPPAAFVVELGCGTGRLLDLLGPRVHACRRIELVDLCPSLLTLASRRARDLDHVHVIHGDATTHRPAEAADCVLLSYALTMIPDWRAAVGNALAMLRPGGLLAVTDFYVSGPSPAAGRVRHGPLTRTLWPLWFGHDGVRLSAEHLPWLVANAQVETLEEHRGPVPLLLGVRAPYYVFVGRRPAAPEVAVARPGGLPANAVAVRRPGRPA